MLTSDKEPTIQTYGFSLVLTPAEIAAADCDRLHEAGCDDGTVVTRDGVTHIAFDREAESLEEAIRSATAQVRLAGFDIARVEMDTMV